MIKISIVLATHNRADFLEPCLHSLCEQTLDPSSYEICVVNNACTDATSSVISATSARNPDHRIFEVFEPIAGLSRARNRGISGTTAPLIAEIDDDATANRDWLECFVLRFNELGERVAAIGGEINPIWRAPPPEWLNPVMKGILSAASNLGSNARFLEPHEGLLECNTCYRREALSAAGNFPAELGRVNNLLLSGEGAVNEIIRHRGGGLFFEPRAVINHVIHADRVTPAWLRKRMFWQGVSDYAMHLYYQRNGLPTNNQLNLDLPLKPADWKFVNEPSAEDLGSNIKKFESLGLILAMTGIIPISNG